MFDAVSIPGQVVLREYDYNQTRQAKDLHGHLPMASGHGCLRPLQMFTVALITIGDAQDAASEACLYLLWKQMGQAIASLVIEWHPKYYVPDNAMFDAEDYDDTITFGAKIISCRDLG